MKKQLPEIDETDTEAWQQEVQKVKRINQPQNPPSPPVYINEITPSINYQNIPNIYELSYLRTGDLSHMDGKTAQRVKRCEYKIEGTLDLHGKTEEIAYDAVTNFIKKSYLQNKRCVLIITGKGLTNTQTDDIFSSHGKLKERTPVWLNAEQLRPLILGFVHPIERLGGSGALYIILRKKR